jgi:taurine transport system ATP-binding protein
MGTKLVVMSPRPGRISHVFELPFSRQYFETGNARAIKACAEFIALREKILQIIFTDEAGTHDE